MNPRGTVARGYGRRHLAEVKRLEPLVNSGGAVCVRCGLPISPGKIRRRDGRLVRNWVPDHSEDRTHYIGPAHYRCNASAGGRKAAARSRVRRTVVRTWGAW